MRVLRAALVVRVRAPVWTNAFRITVTDRVCKAGPMLEATRQSNPFSKFLQ
jgi:hypothetical protein